MTHPAGRPRPHSGRRTAIGLATLSLALTPLAAPVASADPTTDTTPYAEQYRPQFHYSPARNWVNDPNGLVYYKGEYHLFYQHNPQGNDWGNMSWGHAVSKDLVHWKELPVAIPVEGDEMVFSGSVVVDYQNTSGLGTKDNPAMVAIYTAARPGSQAQALAYSLDGGRTFTRYAKNPVLDIGSAEFRDPKVFWHAPTHRWIMVAVDATRRTALVHSSKDLKTWTHESDFGPMNATGGVWECPDLFPLTTGTGRHNVTKWVMIVNLNPGGPQGGSGTQYFTGSFDGHRFIPDEKAYTGPRGTSLGSFDNGTLDGWTSTGTAFGTAPSTGNLDGQAGVMGWTGAGFVNGFHDRDAGTGTLTSPSFTINADHLNFMVGGGNHPHDPAAVPGGLQPSGTVMADFEGTVWPAGWTATGDLARYAPVDGTIGDQQVVSGYLGKGLVNTFLDHDRTQGTLTSPSFTVTTKYLSMLVGGGNHPMGTDAPTAVNLVVDGTVVRTATGSDSESLNWVSWDLSEFAGKTAQVQVVDQNSGGWGHILLDQVVASDQPAKPAARDTSVNLVVDGKVVRTMTGSDSEVLDWRSWDVSDLKGRTAVIQLADNNTGGFGHILADQFQLSGTAAQTGVQRAHWLDQGADHYAAVTWNDAPRGRRLSIAWMNNWQYAGATPTSPWRSSFTVPRELTLVRTGRQYAVASLPVRELRSIESRPTVVRHAPVRGTTALPVSGNQLDMDVTLDVRKARQAGIDVHVGDGEYTRIGVDATTHELFIDRTKSGQTNFSPAFPAVHRAPLPTSGKVVQLRIVVDSNSVEVFTQDGRLAMTDLVFPSPDSDGVRAFSAGGRATVRKAELRHVPSIWARRS